MRHPSQIPPQQRPSNVWLGVQSLESYKLSSACGTVSGSHSRAERSLTPSLGLQLERLKWAPAHEVSWDQQQQLQPLSSPSCCFWPHPPPASLSPKLSLSDPFQGDAIVTSTIPAPQPLGLINGLSARADTRGEVNEAFASPLLLWGLALQTGSQPPHYASCAPRGSHETVFPPDTSVDVVLGGTLALQGAKCKYLGRNLFAPDQQSSISQGVVWRCHRGRLTGGIWAGPSTHLDLFPGPHCPQEKSNFFIIYHGSQALHGTPALFLVTLLFRAALHWIHQAPYGLWGLLKLYPLPG